MARSGAALPMYRHENRLVGFVRSNEDRLVALRNACESTSETSGFRTASMYEATFGTSIFGEILGPWTSRTEEDLWGHDCSRLLDGTTAGASRGALGRCTLTLTGNPRGIDGPSGGGALARGSAFEEPRIPSARFSLEQRPDPSSLRPNLILFRQASRHAAPAKLSPSSARHVSHLGRASPNYPSLSVSLPHVLSSGYPKSASLADLVCPDPRKAQDSNFLEMSSRIGGRSRIDSSTCQRVEEQDTTLIPFRSSRTWPVWSLSRSRRTSPVGSLDHRRKISVTDWRNRIRWARISGGD